MNSEQKYNQIDQAVRAACRDANTPFSNGVASVLYAGEFIALLDGFGWIDGEGYPYGYYDAILKGIKHTLKIEYYPPNVKEFYSQFL